jgi:Tfp pilus assembly protein PilZ
VTDDRRKTRRRNLPFVRSAVLEVRGRNHIVAVQDLSADGAFLSTRLPMQDGERVRLRTVLPRDGREVTLPCQVVWTSEKLDASSGRPAGVAVRFVGLDPTIQRRLAEFSEEGFAPGPEPTPLEHYEYRVLDAKEINVDELNQVGLDGWRLSAALPAPAGFRLIFLRRL